MVCDKKAIISMAAGAIYVISIFLVPRVAFSHVDKDTSLSFPLQFWEYLYENSYYQPIVTMTASLNSEETNWIEKATLGAYSEWLLNNHGTAIDMFRNIFEEADLKSETKNNYQIKLEGWYLYLRQLDEYKEFRIKHNNSDDSHAFNYNTKKSDDPLEFLNLSIYAVFSRNTNKAHDSFHQLQEVAEDSFMERDEIKRFRRHLNTLPSQKKPMWGGVLSAIVPGSGALYAGRSWDALYSFILVGGFAAITGESIVNNGLKHTSTIILGGLGLSFHFGNIYGGYSRVKEYNQSQFYDLDNTSDHILDKYYSP